MDERGQHNKYHQTLLDNISEGIQVVKLIYNDIGEPIDYEYLAVNSVYASFLGYDNQMFPGKRATDFPSNIEPEWFIKCEEILKAGKVDRFEMFNNSLGCWFDVLTIPLGEPGKFAIIHTNISEYKEKEKAEKALRESEAKYRKLFETSNDGFWWIDKYGHLIEVNEGTASMLGYNQEELIGRHWKELVDDEWLHKGYDVWEERKKGNSSRYQTKLKRKDGSSIWVKVSGASLMDEEGQHLGALAAFRDITKLKKAEEELRDSEKKALALVSELEKSDKNKDEFISLLSHEIRNR